MDCLYTQFATLQAMYDSLQCWDIDWSSEACLCVGALSMEELPERS